MKRLILAALFLLHSLAIAGPQPLNDLSVLVDANGIETIQSISHPTRANDFSPLRNGLSAGYTDKVHWLRIRLNPPPTGRLLLEIMPPYLDDLKLFQPDINAHDGFSVKTAGDTHPFASREISSRGFVFRIDFPDHQAQTIYLRLQTTSTSLILARAWIPADYLADQAGEYLSLGFYYGLLLAMIIFNLWHGHWRHDPEHRAFLIYSIVVLFFMLNLNGLVAQYLTPNTPLLSHHLLSGLVIISVGAAAHFHRIILRIDRKTYILNAYFLSLIGLSAACLVASSFGHFTKSAHFLTAASMLLPIFGIWRSIQLMREQHAGSHYLTAAYMISLGSYLITVLSVQGKLDGAHWQLYAFQWGALLSLFTFNLGLFERLRYLKHERDQALEEANQARIDRDAENHAREQQSALLAMLTHEIKTPLSVIRLRLGSKDASTKLQNHADRAVSEIDEIIQRCDLATRIEEAKFEPRLQICMFNELIEESLARLSNPDRIQIINTATTAFKLTTDPSLLRSIIDNLLDNALKYSPAHSSVTLIYAAHKKEQQDGLLLTIKNQPGSAGLPDPDACFKKYYRAPGAHGHSGSGLGLYIVKALVTLLNGRIQYHATPAEITFELWLPQSTYSS